MGSGQLLTAGGGILKGHWIRAAGWVCEGVGRGLLVSERATAAAAF